MMFRRMVRGHSLCDINWMMDVEGIKKSIYMYDPDKKCTRRPDSEIPWPVLYILTRYHRKHRINFGKTPRMEWISEALNNFTQKMKWRRLFINQKLCDDHVAPFSTRYKQKPITRFTMNTEPELNEWLRQLCREVWMVCKVAVDRNRHRMKEYSNSTPLIKWGIKCLLKGQWFVFKTDKDGGYALIKTEQADTIFESLVTTKNMSKYLFRRRDGNTWNQNGKW